MKKRLLSLALSLLLIVCIVPVEAFASTTTTYANIVVFVDFSDTTHNHSEAILGYCYKTTKGIENTERFFNGTSSDQRGLKTYYEKISYGQISVNNIMPQFKDSTITALKLKNNTAYYYTNSLGVDGATVLPEVIQYLKSLDLSSYDLDGNDDGCIDNITLVVPCEYGGSSESNTRSYKSSYSGSETLTGVDGNGVIRNYNVISENNLYFGTQDSGLLIHEFGHTLGAPDLYSESGGTPVGTWDIMSSVGYKVQYPLAYTRSRYFKIFDIPEVTTSKSCELYSATSATYATRNNQAIILKTEYSDDEFFVVEYRQKTEKSAYTTTYEQTLYGSGLVIYRVNTAYGSNYTGEPYHIYVLREDNNISNSYFSSESGRTSFSGLVYEDGTNSGITIKNIGSALGDTITFDVDYGEIEASYWKTEGKKNVSNKSSDNYVISNNVSYYTDEFDNQYFVAAEGSKLSIYSYVNGTWTLISSKTRTANSEEYPKMVKIGTNYYVSVLCDNTSDTNTELYKYDSTSKKWALVYSTELSYEYDLVTDGSKVYLTTVGYTESTGNDYMQPLKVASYDNATGTTKEFARVNSSGYPIRPELVTYNGSVYVAYLDGKLNDGIIYVKQYDSSSNTWKNIASINDAATDFSIGVDNEYLYIFKMDNSYSSSTYKNVLYKYNLSSGGSWQKVGGTVTTVPVIESDITFSNNVPVLMYQDAKTEEICVTYLKDNAWTQLGTSVATAYTTYIGIGAVDGKIIVPYYVYDMDSANSNNIVVKYHTISNTTCTTHSWNAGTVTRDATCAQSGIKTYTCTKCGTTKNVEIPAQSHSYVNGYCSKCSALEPGKSGTNNRVFTSGKTSIRYSGETRYNTSFATANALKTALGVSKFSTIILADGTNFADALAGSYLAAKTSAPIIMVNAKNGADDSSGAKNYIKNNLASGGKIYVLGGENAISKAFYNYLVKTYGSSKVVRLSGATRYETNIAILNAAGGVSGQDLLICDGSNFADALSCSALGKPILLVDKSSVALSSSQKTMVKNAKSVYIIGGTAAVPDGYVSLAKSQGKTPSRIWGATRYETSIKIASTFSSCFAGISTVIATGANFPDGLSGGPLAYALGAPLILTNNESATYNLAKSYVSSKKIVALGGVNALSNATVKSIKNASITSVTY